jgi:hypothetical protein
MDVVKVKIQVQKILDQNSRAYSELIWNKILTPSDTTILFCIISIWNTKIKKIVVSEYIFYLILILYFKNNGMSSTKT